MLLKLLMAFSPLLGTLSFAYPQEYSESQPSWHPAPPGSSRGPCPALNSLANHRFIPHDGFNIPTTKLVAEVEKAFNLNASFLVPDLTHFFGEKLSFSDLGKHNVFEHDGSLTRADFDVNNGDTITFKQDLYRQWLDVLNDHPETYGHKVTLKSAAAARWARIQQAKSTNPKFNLTAKGRVLSYFETATLLLVFGGLENGKAGLEIPINQLEMFIGKWLCLLSDKGMRK